MKYILIILLCSYSIFSQNTSEEKCYILNDLQPGITLEHIESIFSKKIEVTGKNDIVFLGNKVLWFTNRILWRIDYKKYIIKCPYEKNGIFDDKDNDIRVVTDGINSSVTNLFIWNNLVVKQPILERNGKKIKSKKMQ